MYIYTKRAVKRHPRKPPKEKTPQGTSQHQKKKIQQRKKQTNRNNHHWTKTHAWSETEMQRNNLRSRSEGGRQKPPPNPREPRKTTTKTLPVPTQDRLHFPLVISARTSRALSQEPLSSQELHSIHHSLLTEIATRENKIVLGRPIISSI